MAQWIKVLTASTSLSEATVVNKENGPPVSLSDTLAQDKPLG